MLQIQEQQQLQAPQLAAAAARAGGVSPAGPHMPGSACAGMLQHPMAHAALLQAVGGQMQQSQAAYSRGGAAELDRKRSVSRASSNACCLLRPGDAGSPGGGGIKPPAGGRAARSQVRAFAPARPSRRARRQRASPPAALRLRSPRAVRE